MPGLSLATRITKRRFTETGTERKKSFSRVLLVDETSLRMHISLPQSRVSPHTCQAFDGRTLYSNTVTIQRLDSSEKGQGQKHRFAVSSKCCEKIDIDLIMTGLVYISYLWFEPPQDECKTNWRRNRRKVEASDWLPEACQNPRVSSSRYRLRGEEL